MKILKTGAALALLMAVHFSAAAQSNLPVNEPDYNKPKVFSDLPNTLSLRTGDAEALLSLPVGATANANLAVGFTLSGTVVSKSSSTAASQSVVVKSTLRRGAVFTFTRIKNADGTAVYRGRIISKEAGDVLEIAKESGVYVLRKKAYYDVLNE